MANSVIEQQPLYTTVPVSSDVIFTVSNDTAVANQTKVKFVAEVHIGLQPVNLSVNDDLIATFKTTPNNAGVGIFNFQPIVESYVAADNEAANDSQYKTTTTTDTVKHPIHLIDKFSKNVNLVRYMAIQFKVEFLGATDSAGNQDDNTVRIQVGTAQNSNQFLLFNGYLKYTDVLRIDSNNNFGFDFVDYEPAITFPTSNTFKMLTNAPNKLYANIDDYGTIAFLQTNSADYSNITKAVFTYYKTDGTTATDSVTKNLANGINFTYNSLAERQIGYLGCFPANLRNWSSTFQNLVTNNLIQGSYYTLQIQNGSSQNAFQTYTINIECPDERQYESIRLCWLNQFGVWDYYTFTLKSTRSINTSETTYNKLKGTWNKRKYSISSFRGGKKVFRKNATETIKINTNYISENDNTILEELMNSPEVYMLDGYQNDTPFSALTNYVTPVRITTTSHTTKTVANDKLIQYTFDIEKSLTLRTQSV